MKNDVLESILQIVLICMLPINILQNGKLLEWNEEMWNTLAKEMLSPLCETDFSFTGILPRLNILFSSFTLYL